jgi:hypothetical protein
MGLPVRVVNCPDPAGESAPHYLWLLVGGGDYFQRATAFYST